MNKCRMFHLDNYLAVPKKIIVSRCRPLYVLHSYVPQRLLKGLCTVGTRTHLRGKEMQNKKKNNCKVIIMRIKEGKHV